MLAFRSPLVGQSPAIQEILKIVGSAAQADTSVLIVGEKGTGKEHVAHAIHEHSLRGAKPFISVNCEAISPENLEAELFGHVRGVAGALQNQQGRIEMAQGGTLFLDEISEIPLLLQAKLVRVLMSKQLEPSGSNQGVELNVRVVASSSRDLDALLGQGVFREDFLACLNATIIEISALRERKEDIPILAKHFIEQYNQMTAHTVDAPTGEILAALVSYDWPGNISELENLMERLVILKGKGAIELGDLPLRIFQKYAEGRPQGDGALSGSEFPHMALPNHGLDLKTIVDAFENHLIDQALARTNNNKNRASELLQMNRTTLVEKLRKRGMITPAPKRNKEDEIEGMAPAGDIT